MAEAEQASEQDKVTVTGIVKWFNVKSEYESGSLSGDREAVKFSVVVEKGNEAANVTGSNGEPVRGSPYAADKRRGYRQWFYSRRGRGAGRGGLRQEGKDSSEVVEGGGSPCRYRPRRGRGGGGFGESYGGGYYQQGDGEGGSRGRGRGRRPRSPDGQGQGEQSGDEGSRGPQRPRYRRRGAPRPRTWDSVSESGKVEESSNTTKPDENQLVQNTTTESQA
ncbi:hypothetical protein RN001_011416 [Aquatica leii]|uniref:CSD domain-containing protein n=1 Tax=Aquatica leii TaxID=1421715 RepID=A0AAN7SEI5_9COLE|nr:hypothetical protein RN001_011416 [Aquatica leii]